ncbi:MAG: hydroxyethylthiazole kinase [Thermomicrobiales bacterium]
MSGIDYAAEAARSLATIGERTPLIHHITNVVVTNDVANLTLSFGASPVMAYAPEEVAEMAALAGALALNIGTLSKGEIEAMLIAGRSAAEHNVPIILDPVGAGATRFRTESALRLLSELPITVLRGNRGEIGALVGSGQMRGVDASATRTRARSAKPQPRTSTTVAVTGAVDVVVGGGRVLEVHNGHALLRADYRLRLHGNRLDRHLPRRRWQSRDPDRARPRLLRPRRRARRRTGERNPPRPAHLPHPPDRRGRGAAREEGVAGVRIG